MGASTKIHMNDILNNPFMKERKEMDAKDIFAAEIVKDRAVAPLDVVIPDIPKTGKMLVRIELDKFSRDNNRMHVSAEIDNQDDLNGFLYKFREYIPRATGWRRIMEVLGK